MRQSQAERVRTGETTTTEGCAAETETETETKTETECQNAEMPERQTHLLDAGARQNRVNPRRDGDVLVLLHFVRHLEQAGVLFCHVVHHQLRVCQPKQPQTHV